MSEPPHVGIVVSRYPALSHVFIRREVEALRRQGVGVETLSLRSPTPAELLTAADRAEAQRTPTLQPVRPFTLLRGHLRRLRKSPHRYVATLALALTHRPPGLRGALWSLFYFAEAIQAASELEQRGVRHVHSHFANAGGSVGLFAAHALGSGWSLTLHGLSDYGRPREQRIAEKIARARFVVCVSEDGRRHALAIAGEACADRIHVVRCGLEPEAFRERALGTEPGRHPGPLRLVCVGRLAPEKAHTGLIEALADAREAGLAAELRLIGDGPERERIEETIVEREVEDAVTLVGALGGEELREELCTADLFVLSSLMEGLPVTLMEAMAVGTPVVAPRLAGIPELVRDGEEGWLYEPGHFGELADLLVGIDSARDALAEMGARGRRRVRELHDADASARRLRALFEAAEAAGTALSAARGRR